MSDYAEAGAWLRGMRRAAEITQHELAEMLLLDEKQIVAAESGNVLIDESNLSLAARVFGVSAHSLKESYRTRLGLNKAAA